MIKKIKPVKKLKLIPSSKKVGELIVRRRRQMIIHSCIYYEYGLAIVTDEQFDKWAYELRDLQNKYPLVSSNAEWGSFFENWDGTSGYDLPLKTEFAIRKSEQLIDYARENKLLI